MLGFYTGDSRHIFRRPTCFSHPLHDAALTPLALVFGIWHSWLWHLIVSATFVLVLFFEVACPFKVWLTYVLFSIASIWRF